MYKNASERKWPFKIGWEINELKKAFLPVFFLDWLFCLRFIEFPLHRSWPFLTIVYALISWPIQFYIVSNSLYWIVYSRSGQKPFIDTYLSALHHCTNMIAVIFLVISGCYYSKVRINNNLKTKYIFLHFFFFVFFTQTIS